LTIEITKKTAANTNIMALGTTHTIDFIRYAVKASTTATTRQTIAHWRNWKGGLYGVFCAVMLTAYVTHRHRHII